ncbi:MAG: GtrA family protein [Caulobacteraceae bacterium]
MFRRLWSVAPVLSGALLILVVVAVRGYPMAFTDTDNYYKQGRTVVLSVGRALHLAEPEPPPADARAAALQQLRKGYARTSMGARSPFYGVFLYVLTGVGTLWLLALAQAMAAAWIVRLLWRSMAPGSPGWTYYALMAALAVCTTLPFVAAFAVPDIFAAVAAGAIVLLLVYREKLDRAEQIGLSVLLAYSLLIHASHLLVAVCLLSAGAGLLLLLKVNRRAVLVSAGMVGAAIVTAMAINAVYAAGFQLTTGHKLGRPPFLMARVLADGPGRDYLRAACARGEDWELCRFKDNKLKTSDEILWSNIKGVGVFNLSNPVQRMALEDQEKAFVLKSIAHDPVGQVTASLKNWGFQLTQIHLDDAVKDPTVYLKHKYWRKTWVGYLLRQQGPCTAAGECKPRINWRTLVSWHRAVMWMTLAFLAFRLTRPDIAAAIRRRRDWNDPQVRALAAVALIAAAIVINAAVCGILSGVFPRYQSRIAWLIPAAAGLLALAFAPSWKRERWEEAVMSVFGVRASPAFVRFAMVGVAGFATDAVILHLLVRAGGLNAWTARLISFPIAVLVTWALNRAFTFKTSGQDGRAREAALYFTVQGLGGAANLAVYSISLLLVPVLKVYLLIPLALGSAVGLCVTYLGSKHYAFKRAEPEEGSESPVLRQAQDEAF